MRCTMTLKDADAMERATRALAEHRYAARGEDVVPEGHPREWKSWLLEVDHAEVEAIRAHVRDGDIVDVKPLDDTATSTDV